MEKMINKYPIYIPSKGRWDICYTADFLIEDKVDFKIVIEPQEKEKYENKYGKNKILVLPFSNLGMGSIPARNWIKEHATKNGHERHWILDDNIRYLMRRVGNRRIKCDSGIVFNVVEEFVNRYENIAIAGLNYSAFVAPGKMPPFYLNVHVYSCMLILNSLPHKWRGRYNEDTDLCLQVLADGWCTVLFNAFCCMKMRTMTMKGGNTDRLYVGDGRLKMSRSLERMWPGVVTTYRRYKRPQHHVYKQWRNFDTPLKLKKEINLEKLKNKNWNMKLVQEKKIKSKRLKRFYEKELNK